MDEEKKTIRPDEQAPYQPGEKGFAVFLLLIGLFFTWQAVKLYQQAPGAASYGAVPLFCSGLIDLFAILILIFDRNKKSENSGLSLAAALKNVVSYLFNVDILVVLAMIVVYCAALYLNLGFMLVTPVFLWAIMTYLGRGKFLNNVFWTAVCMAFIYLVFKVLFNVVLP